MKEAGDAILRIQLVWLVRTCGPSAEGRRLGKGNFFVGTSENMSNLTSRDLVSEAKEKLRIW
jgi:hypothetical protein